MDAICPIVQALQLAVRSPFISFLFWYLHNYIKSRNSCSWFLLSVCARDCWPLWLRVPWLIIRNPQFPSRCASKKNQWHSSIALLEFSIWVVVKIMVPFWVPIIIRHLLFRVPKIGNIILTATHTQRVHIHYYYGIRL